jgi:hypothetical protein
MRLERGMLQREVADMIGVCKGTIIHWENNKGGVRSKYSAGGLGLWRQHELGRRRNNSWPKDDACSQNLEVCTLDAGRGFATTTGMPHEIPTIPVSGHYEVQRPPGAAALKITRPRAPARVVLFANLLSR